MRSPRVEGPPVLQPVADSSSVVPPAIKEVVDAHIEQDVIDEDVKVPTPPMPVLIQGEDYVDDDDDDSSFVVLDELSSSKPNDSKETESFPKPSSPPVSLSNGILGKEFPELDKPITNEGVKVSDERINGDHEEPVLEKFFRLFTPSGQDAMQTEAVSEYLTAKLAEASGRKTTDAESTSAQPTTQPLPTVQEPVESSSEAVSTVPSPSKRRRQVSRKSLDVERSPSPKRMRRKSATTNKEGGTSSPEKNKPAGKNKKNEESTATDKVEDVTSPRKTVRKSPQRRGPKPKNAATAKGTPSKPGRKPAGKGDKKDKDRPAGRPATIESRYMRSPYVIGTSESDSIVSRFQVVNPGLRDAASVNVLDHPFKHSVKVPPVPTLSVKPWVCVFCGLGTTFNGLGCLFGPYFIDLEKVTLPANMVCPYVEPNKAKPVDKPKPSVGRPVLSSPPPSPPITSTATPSSPPASPVPNGDNLVNGDDPSVSEPTSEPSSRAECENANDTSVPSSCRETRSHRRSTRGSTDDSQRPSSISSFRNSKTRNSQTLIAAKDVRRSSTDSDKKNGKGFKQLDIAAMFFSTSDQTEATKSAETETASVSETGGKTVPKEVSARRRSEQSSQRLPEELRSLKLKLDRSEAIPVKKPSSNENKGKAESEVSKQTASNRSKESNSKSSGATPVKRMRKSKSQAANDMKEASESCKGRRGRTSSKATVKKEPDEDVRLSSNGEVWFHMECVLWASGTYLNGKVIVGLEETLTVALQAVCKSCHKLGAMVACVQRGCDRTFHFFCAVKEGAYLDHEQFCIYCAKHKSKILLSKFGGQTQSKYANI